MIEHLCKNFISIQMKHAHFYFYAELSISLTQNFRHPFKFLSLELSPFVVLSCDISVSNLTMNSCEVWPQPQLWSEAVMVRSDMSGLLYRWSILSLTDLAAI